MNTHCNVTLLLTTAIAVDFFFPSAARGGNSSTYENKRIALCSFQTYIEIFVTKLSNVAKNTTGHGHFLPHTPEPTSDQ